MKSPDVKFWAAASMAAALVSGPAEASKTPPKDTDILLYGAGDIGHCTSKGDDALAEVIDKKLKQNKNALVFTAGDNAYPDGTAKNFNDCFDPSWGRFKEKIKLPTPGNHEYHDPNPTAKPYFDYFGKAAEGVNGKGYYAKDFGNWRAYILNSETALEEQKKWLQKDLKDHPSQYKMVIAHPPLFSSSAYRPGDKRMQSFWDILSKDSRAKLMINGHAHHAEVFKPQMPNGKRDDKQGIREVIIGTGGASLYGVRENPVSNSEFLYNRTPAVLELALNKDGSYEGNIISAKEKTLYKFNHSSK